MSERKGLWKWSAPAICLAGLLSFGPASAIDIGEMAPNFFLSSPDGDSHSLTAYYSHPVLILFVACGSSDSEALARSVQQDIYARYASQGLVILGIDTQGCSSTALSSFGTLVGAQYALLMNGTLVLSQYGMFENSLCLVDAIGKVTYTASNYDATALGDKVVQALQDAANTKAMTWGVIKNLYK
jgi:peroxiredoxin